MRREQTWGALGIVLLSAAVIAVAQDISVEKNKLLAKRAAEADAYRKLAEAVYGLQINARTYVQDFVTESDEIRSEVDTFIKGVRLGTPMWYDDLSCEIEAEVTVAKVVETLKSAHREHYRGDSISTEDFTHMKQRIEKQVIKVVGMGAPRPDLPPDLSAPALERLGSAPVDAPRPPIPDVWRSVPPQARLMALKAAAEDAKRKLAERIIGLRLTSRSLVRDFAAESDEIRTEVVGKIYPQEVDRYLHHDELIAEVTVKVPTEQVITTIKRLHSRHYEGDDVRGHDIEKIIKSVVKKDFVATGMGIPPEKYLRSRAAQTQSDLPTWATGPIEAVGEATDDAIDTPQGRLMAARAAELVAKRKLAEQIAGLEIRSATTVQDFVTQHDVIESSVDAVIVDAVVVETRFTEDTAIVRVALPGMRVWEMIHSEMRREARR